MGAPGSLGRQTHRDYFYAGLGQGTAFVHCQFGVHDKHIELTPLCESQRRPRPFDRLLLNRGFSQLGRAGGSPGLRSARVPKPVVLVARLVVAKW